MLGDDLQAFSSKVKSGDELESLVNDMRVMKLNGVTREDALQLLRQIRDETTDDAIEDRILELMDVAYGFCSPHNRVWID